MEMDVGDGGEVVPAVDTEFGLFVVGGGADEVEGDGGVGREEAGEVEELVEVALGWKWYHYYCCFGFRLLGA